jgi:phosphoribosylglycinamide formyltransferase-1
MASGAGSNVRALCTYFDQNPEVKILAVYSNRAQAGALDVAREFGISAVPFGKAAWDSGQVWTQMKELDPDLIVLAGFLKQIPAVMVRLFPNKIINIHPALLPKCGGKGMYGMHVHQAVKDSQDKQTGITIHFVNENYDEGAIIAQYKTELNLSDSVETIAQKVQVLEHQFFGPEIAQLLLPK